MSKRQKKNFNKDSLKEQGEKIKNKKNGIRKVRGGEKKKKRKKMYLMKLRLETSLT